MKYRIVCKKYGWIDIAADSEEDAIEKAEKMPDHMFSWTSADEHEVVEEIR